MDIDDQDTTMMDVVDDVDGEENTTRRGSPTKRERNRDDNAVEADAGGDAGSKPNKKAKANTATSSFVTVPTTASSSKASQSMTMMMKKEEPQPSTSTSVLSPATTERARDEATVSSVENLTTQPPSLALPTKTGASGAAATTAASAPTTITTASTGKDNKVATPETVEPSSLASSSSSVTFVGNPAVFMWTCKFVLVVVVALLTFNGTLSSVRMSLEATLSSSSSSSPLIDSSTATNNSDNDGILSGTTSNNEAAATTATTATTMDTNTIKNSHRKIVLSFSMTEEVNDADETVSDEEDPVLLYWIQIQDTAIKKGTMQEYLFHPVETFGTNRQARHSFPGHIFVAGQPLNQNDGSNNNDTTNNDVHNICSWAVWTMPTPEDDDDDPFIVTVVLEKKKKNPNSNDVSIIPGLVACGDIDNNNTDEL